MLLTIGFLCIGSAILIAGFISFCRVKNGFRLGTRKFSLFLPSVSSMIVGSIIALVAANALSH